MAAHELGVRQFFVQALAVRRQSGQPPIMSPIQSAKLNGHIDLRRILSRLPTQPYRRIG